MEIKVYKFDEGSLPDLKSLQELCSIIRNDAKSAAVFIVQSIGQTRSLLERLAAAYQSIDPAAQTLLDEIRNYHNQIATELSGSAEGQLFDDLANILVEIEWMLEEEPHPDPDFNFAQIVSMGELLASRIIAEGARIKGSTKWLDMRGFITTDNNYIDGEIETDKTAGELKKIRLNPGEVIVTQGGIGCTSENFNTLLSPETSVAFTRLLTQITGSEYFNHFSPFSNTGQSSTTQKIKVSKS